MPKETKELYIPSQVKRCNNCHQFKPRDNYGPHAKTKDGLNTYCNPCRRELKKVKYREKHWTERLTSKPKHAQLTRDRLIQQLSQQNGKCYWFNVVLDTEAVGRDKPNRISLDRLDVDGPYTHDNVVLTTTAANMGRQITPVEDWIDFVREVRHA